MNLPKQSQIVAMGGGGFSEGKDLALDAYVLSLAQRERPRVCFLPTASGDAEGYLQKFYTAYRSLNCRPSHLSLFRPFTSNIESFLMKQHVIMVGGGNTRAMLALWAEWGLGEILLRACTNGTILSGISAGAICWFEQGLTDSNYGGLTPLRCLGFLKGSCCPHYADEPARRPAYENAVATGLMQPGLALDDDVAAHFEGGALKRVISSRNTATAYRVTIKDGECEEHPLAVERLEPRPMVPGAQIEAKRISRVFSGAPWERRVGYAQAVRAGSLICVKGTVALEEDGSLFSSSDPYEQAVRCFEQIKAALEKIGVTLAHVVRTRMFVTDISKWEQFGKAHEEFFGKAPPATTMVEVKALISPGLLIEVEADAVVHSSEPQ